jgi:2-polyprenyl-3-methyl-5-hydroxy-6-metoxy-1,4-benzoquinol methylase
MQCWISAHDLGLEAKGIDIDGAAIAIANENFSGRGTFEAIWLYDLAARGDTFDMVYMSEVIEHVNDPERFIAAIAAVLKPGGLLYLTAPDGGHPLVPRKFENWGMVTPPNHLTYFTREGMRQLLGRHGLEIEGFQWAFKPGMKLFARKVQ